MMTEETNDTDNNLLADQDVNASAIPQAELERLTDDIIAALKTVYDPEIPSDVYEIGLIYKVDITCNHGAVRRVILVA